MIKTKEKGGFFGKALAAACSVALVASLTPAAALTAFAAPQTQPVPDRITVKVVQKDADGNLVTKATEDYSTVVTAVAGPQNALYYAEGKWGVASTLNTEAETIENVIKNAIGASWTWTGANDPVKANPEVTITSGFDASNEATLPDGVLPEFAQTVTTNWNTLAASTNFYGDVTNKGFDGFAIPAAGTATTACIAQPEKSVFNWIGTTQADASQTASTVATNNASESPANNGYAFVAGMTNNEARTEPEKAASMMVQGVKEITVTYDYSGLDKVDRIAGANWDNTMADVVDEAATAAGGYATAFTTADTFVIATANGYEDALAASGFAGLIGAPLLMTDRNQLTQETVDVINENRTSDATALKIYLIGGNMAVSDEVAAALGDLALISQGGFVERIAGENSWDTALAIYEKGKTFTNKWSDGFASGAAAKEIIVATSIDFQDALSVSPYAYANKLPVILTNDKAVLSEDVAEVLQKDITAAAPLIKQATFVGGSVVVSDTVSDQLGNIFIKRLAGTTAYDTSNAVAQFLTTNGTTTFGAATTACIATGLDYLDALSSCNYTGTAKTVLLLADNTNETTVNGFLAKNSKTANPAGLLEKALIFGGTVVVSDQVALDANAVLS